MSNLPDPNDPLATFPQVGSPSDPADMTLASVAQPPPSSVMGTGSVPGLTKEQEPPQSTEINKLEETVSDVELEPDLENFGIEKLRETIDLPPDISKMGVVAVGPAQPVVSTQSVKLPISDDQVVAGLQAPIVSSLRWLATWCIKQLKRAHVMIKSVGGKAVRQNEV